jgi:hypothetical protein
MNAAIALALLLGSTTAQATEAAPAAAPSEAAAPARAAGLGLEVDLLAGGRFPQLTSKMGLGPDGLLRLGWSSLLDGHLELLAEVGYGQPKRDLSSTDPRLASGSYDATLTVQDLGLGLGAAWRFADIGGVMPYAGLVAQTHLVKALTKGTAGSAFGQNTETATVFGGAALGGVAWHLGPGVLLGELRLGFVPVKATLTGDSNLGAATLLVGYGLSF